MKSMIRLYAAASKQGFGITTTRSSIAPKRFVCEIMQHKPHKDTHLSFSRGAVYGDTPLCAEVEALSSVGVVFDYASIAAEIVEQALLLTVDLYDPMQDMKDALDGMLEALRAR